MSDPDDKPPLESPTKGRPISRNEILEVMADEGYSGDGRKAWLKEVLTQVAQGEDTDPDPERQELMQEIKEILHNQVDDDPKADDVS